MGVVACLCRNVQGQRVSRHGYFTLACEVVSLPNMPLIEMGAFTVTADVVSVGAWCSPGCAGVRYLEALRQPAVGAMANKRAISAGAAR